jgi:glutathione synthase/RimK-type ligase-like ATP-grasp enzyme
MRFAVVAHRETETNVALARAGGGSVLSPREALLALGPGDVVLGRLDVAESLDGIEPGLDVLDRLEAIGVAVLNRSCALAAAHDKLLSARALRRAALPHPWTRLLGPDLEFPLVLRPRFGSCTRDATVCPDADALRAAVEAFAFRPWLRAHDAIVQQHVERTDDELRLIVAAGSVVGAAPSDGVSRLAEAAAAAVGADFVGIDLVATGTTHLIVDIDPAVELTDAANDAVDVLLAVAAGPRAA